MSLSKADLSNLLEHAKQAAQNAYAPYSGYRVGAALLCADGRIITGANVENASYSLTICAERAAIFTAINSGIRDFAGIAIYVDSDASFPPCGACRQVLAEFAPQIPIVYANHHEVVETDLAKLLPGAFNLKR